MARGTLLPVYFCSTSLFLSFYGMHRTLHWLALTHTQLEPITKTNTILAYASRFFCTMSKTSIFRWKSKIVSHFETGFSNSQEFLVGIGLQKIDTSLVYRLCCSCACDYCNRVFLSEIVIGIVALVWLIASCRPDALVAVLLYFMPWCLDALMTRHVVRALCPQANTDVNN